MFGRMCVSKPLKTTVKSEYKSVYGYFFSTIGFEEVLTFASFIENFLKVCSSNFFDFLFIETRFRFYHTLHPTNNLKAFVFHCSLHFFPKLPQHCLSSIILRQSIF